MPRRLLREPHLLAHELRTPLTVLAGWHSLIQAGDISPQTTPAAWGHAMDACERAVSRLNLIINEACDEAEALVRVRSGRVPDEFTRMIDSTHEAVTHSREVLAQLQRSGREQTDGYLREEGFVVSSGQTSQASPAVTRRNPAGSSRKAPPVAGS